MPTLLLILLLFCGSAQAETARVVHVIDGDTVILDDSRHVRLLGINTPEVAGKKRPAEAGGEAAKRWLKNQLEGTTVKLVGDLQTRDKYGRTLFYLFDLQDNLVNEQLLAKGFAVLSIHPPNLKYLTRLQIAQQRAETAKLGIWGRSAYRPVTLKQALKAKRSGWQRILVTPEAIKKSSKFTRLILSSNADIRIPKQNLRYFPKLESYLNHELELRGWISWRKGHASILVRHPSALVKGAAD